MRGKKVKAIRKKVYGDLAIDTKYVTNNGTTRCIGKREEYQSLKKKEKEWK